MVESGNSHLGFLVYFLALQGHFEGLQVGPGGLQCHFRFLGLVHQRGIGKLDDHVTFLNKVRVGHVLMLSGRINAAFGSSMEIEVEVGSEDPRTGERKLTTTALATIVAVDDAGAPRRVVPLALETEDERQRAAQAAERRRARLAARRPD